MYFNQIGLDVLVEVQVNSTYPKSTTINKNVMRVNEAYIHICLFLEKNIISFKYIRNRLYVKMTQKYLS